MVIFVLAGGGPVMCKLAASVMTTDELVAVKAVGRSLALEKVAYVLDPL